MISRHTLCLVQCKRAQVENRGLSSRILYKKGLLISAVIKPFYTACSRRPCPSVHRGDRHRCSAFTPPVEAAAEPERWDRHRHCCATRHTSDSRNAGTIQFVKIKHRSSNIRHCPSLHKGPTASWSGTQHRPLDAHNSRGADVIAGTLDGVSHRRDRW